MTTHETTETCPVCGGPAALTTEWGWIDDSTCTAVLCCPDCRTCTGMQDDAVEVAHAETEEAALAGIDADGWRRRMQYHIHVAVTATWAGDQYVVGDQGWYSRDGDNWTDRGGHAVVGETFDRAKITLAGGPRDGVVVA